MKRREAREVAFILIFEKSFRSESMEELIEFAKVSRTLELDDYSYNLACSVAGSWDELNEKITPFLSNWRLERLSRVSAALLRLSFYEIEHFDDIPNSVTINEAVELAKKYGTMEDASYINGVLGGFVRKLPDKAAEAQCSEEPSK